MSATDTTGTEAEQRGSSRRWALRLSTAAGIGLSIAGLAFVGGRIAEGWSEYGEVIAGADWGWLILALPLSGLAMTTVGLMWRHITVELGGTVSRRQILVWYHLGQLGKYLPGGLWPMVGRSEMAVRGGLARPTAYNSVALSMGSAYLCASIVCALLLPLVLASQRDLSDAGWALGLIPVGLVALHPAILGRILRIAERVLGEGERRPVPPWRQSVALVVRHAPSWALVGTATWLVALIFTPDAPFLQVVFAAVLSWVSGWLVIFVPGGLGVREAAFAAAATSLRPEIAATVAVVARLVFMASDALGALIVVPLARRHAIATAPSSGPAGAGGGGDRPHSAAGDDPDRAQPGGGTRTRARGRAESR